MEWLLNSRASNGALSDGVAPNISFAEGSR